MAKKRQRKNQRGRRLATPPRRHRWPWLVGVAVVLVGVGLLLWSPWSHQASVPPGTLSAAEQSSLAPRFTLPSTSGEQVALADYLGKQAVVLVFYMGDF